MHPTAMENGRKFFTTYVRPEHSVVDIGSQNVNGSLFEICPSPFYTGVDFVAGKNVDIVVDNTYDAYSIPIPSRSIDHVVSSSCFEHSEMFWLTFLEAMRILRPEGLLYLNVPANGPFHRYPVDCWRFYPDSGHALVKWAKRNGVNAVLLESFTTEQEPGMWNDFVAVFLKDESCLSQHPKRILTSQPTAFTNGWIHGSQKIFRHCEAPEDMRRRER
jgi:SAM-dependent methyltransferase